MELVGELPPPGQITSRSELPELEATEIVLSNGMRVSPLVVTPSPLSCLHTPTLQDWDGACHLRHFTKTAEAMHMHEVLLALHLQVTYKQTDFLHDQVLLSGFAAGGLTEVRRFMCLSLVTSRP